MNGQIDSSHYIQRRPSAYRELLSQPDASYLTSHSRRASIQIPEPEIRKSTHYQQSHQIRYLPTISDIPETVPTALLTLEFIISRSNDAFAEALSLPYDMESKAVKDLVIPSEREKIARLQHNLILELREIALLPTAIRTSSINGGDSRTSIAAGVFQDRSEYWTFCLPNGQSRGFPVSISLGKSSVFFFILTLVQNIKLPITLPMPSSYPSSSWSPPVVSQVPVYSPQSASADRILSGKLSNAMHTTHPHHLQPLEAAPFHGENGIQPLQSSSNTDLRHYRQRSSSQTQESGTSPSTLSNSTGRSSIPSLYGSDASREKLRHLRLPPIRTTGIQETDHTNIKSKASFSGMQSPDKVSIPGSAKRKKRRRIDIGEMLR